MALVSIPLAGAAAFTLMYKVAKPSQYLVRTGLFIEGTMGMKVSRKAWLLPGQQLTRVTMTPINLNFTLNCLSQQYLPFKMPVTYTLSPFDPTSLPSLEKDSNGDSIEVSSEDLFKRFVQKMSNLDSQTFETTILGVVHGETRVLAARMSIDAINDDRDAFRDEVVARVQSILTPYGLRVDNANIAELIEDQRADGAMGYLQARERKKLSSAVQMSEIDVAEAEQMGNIGKKEREARTRQEIAKLEAETIMIEYDTQKNVAEGFASLAEVKAESRRREEVSEITATAASNQKKEELQQLVEEARQEQEKAAKKAQLLTSAEVERLCAIVQAEGVKEAAIIEATGKARGVELMAAAKQKEGEAQAAALLADLMARADGERAKLDAQAVGTRDLVAACGGNPQLLEPVLMIYNRIPQKVAEEGARAVQGLQPQIWSMSGEEAGTSVARMVGGLAPAMDMFSKYLGPDATKRVAAAVRGGLEEHDNRQPVLDVKDDGKKL